METIELVVFFFEQLSWERAGVGWVGSLAISSWFAAYSACAMAIGVSGWLFTSPEPYERFESLWSSRRWLRAASFVFAGCMVGSIAGMIISQVLLRSPQPNRVNWHLVTIVLGGVGGFGFMFTLACACRRAAALAARDGHARLRQRARVLAVISPLVVFGAGFEFSALPGIGHAFSVASTALLAFALLPTAALLSRAIMAGQEQVPIPPTATL